LKRDLRLVQAKFRQRNIKKYGTKYELDDAMTLDKEFQELTTEIAECEAHFELVKAVAEGYEGFRNAASREMFRRSSEAAPRD